MNGLRSWIARRLLLGVLQTAAVVLLVFALTEALPGDAAVAFAGDQPDPQRIAAVREAMGLDRPAHERLADWVMGLLHGDFGTSLTSGRPVAGFLADGFGPTLLLATVTVVLLVPVGLGLGVLAARHEVRGHGVSVGTRAGKGPARPAGVGPFCVPRRVGAPEPRPAKAGPWPTGRKSEDVTAGIFRRIRRRNRLGRLEA